MLQKTQEGKGLGAQLTASLGVCGDEDVPLARQGRGLESKFWVWKRSQLVPHSASAVSVGRRSALAF